MEYAREARGKVTQDYSCYNKTPLNKTNEGKSKLKIRGTMQVSETFAA